jgi:hypothetical protein
MDMEPDADRPAWCPPHIWNAPAVVRTRRLSAALREALAGGTPKREEYIITPPNPRPPIPARLAPHGRPTIQRRDRLHPQRFGRLIRQHDRLCRLLEALPNRHTQPRVRARLETQFRNRLLRLRRQLGLRAPEPPRRSRYRISAAARMLGVCTKTVLRWEEAGLIKSRRSWWGAHRYFRDADLRRLRARLKG